MLSLIFYRYRYYEDPLTKAQYSVDSTGYWFLFDPERGCYEPIVPVLGSSQKAGKENGVSSDDVSSAKPLKSKKQFPCGIQFDDDDHPIYPKNSDGFPILPVDDNGTPFFPRDEYKRPIFPYDKTKKCATFPVDDTDEPIFPRNDQNKPIVPVDDKGND
jgi:hypothetical protein